MRDVRVLFFGDSLVAGVGDPDGQGWVGRVVAAGYAAGQPVTAYNLGVRRDTSTDVLARWEGEMSARRAPAAETLVVFSFGANDATIESGRLRVPPDTTVANLRRALESAASIGLPTFVVGAPPVNDDAQRRRILELTAPMREVAASLGVPFADVAAAVDRHQPWHDEASQDDGAHPGRSGYSYLASLIADPWLTWIKNARATPKGQWFGER